MIDAVPKKVFFSRSGKEQIRLDRLLTQCFPTLSRAYLQKLIAEGAVQINGQSVKKKTPPCYRDRIELFIKPPSTQPALTPQDLSLQIVYEDDHLLCVDKPAGLVVHPAPGHPDNTLINGLLFYCDRLPTPPPYNSTCAYHNRLRPGLVHRLDKETSGLLLVAKTAATHSYLSNLFKERQIQKRYLAFSVGTPSCDKIDAPLARHPYHRKQIHWVTEGGKAALTYLTPIIPGKSITLLALFPQTGRTHQLRVHLRKIGCPILGDPLYGMSKINQKLGASQLLLHAQALRFPHPTTGRLLELTTPAPPHFQRWAHLIDPDLVLATLDLPWFAPSYLK